MASPVCFSSSCRVVFAVGPMSWPCPATGSELDLFGGPGPCSAARMHREPVPDGRRVRTHQDFRYEALHDGLCGLDVAGPQVVSGLREYSSTFLKAGPKWNTAMAESSQSVAISRPAVNPMTFGSRSSP